MASTKFLRSIGAFPENKGNIRRLAEDYESALGIVPFVGAGLSIPYGFPSWTRFIMDQARHAGIEEQVTTFLKSGRYEEAADALETSIKKRAFADAIEDAFGDHHLRGKEFVGSMALIPELATGPVITTNFDHLLERAFLTAGKPFESVVWGARVDLIKKALSHNRRFLLKLHGDVDDRADRILTMHEYKKAYHSSSRVLPRVLKEIFSTRPVLFLGCSLCADRIVGVLADIASESQLANHYAVVEAPVDKSERRERANFLSEHNIRPIWYPTGQHEMIESLLELLLQQRHSTDRTGTLEVPTIEVSEEIEKETDEAGIPGRGSLSRIGPRERQAIVHEFSLVGQRGTIIVSFFEDQKPAELWLSIEKPGSTVAGLLNGIGVAVSVGLQHQIPLKVYTAEFSHTRFEPAGFTDNPEIPIAKSLMDYIFRWIELRVLQDRTVSNGEELSPARNPQRGRELPRECASVTHNFSIAGHEGTLTVLMYKDGQPCAIQLRLSKEGSTVAGLADSWCSSVSIALQHGVSLKIICDKFQNTRFEPSGFTGNEQIIITKSIFDYVARWLELRFLTVLPQGEAPKP